VGRWLCFIYFPPPSPPSGNPPARLGVVVHFNLLVWFSPPDHVRFFFFWEGPTPVGVVRAPPQLGGLFFTPRALPLVNHKCKFPFGRSVSFRKRGLGGSPGVTQFETWPGLSRFHQGPPCPSDADDLLSTPSPTSTSLAVPRVNEFLSPPRPKTTLFPPNPSSGCVKTFSTF